MASQQPAARRRVAPSPAAAPKPAPAPAPKPAAPVQPPAADPRGSSEEEQPKPASTRRRVEPADPDEQVMVDVPRAFKLQIAGSIIEYAAGVQEMPSSHADHVYARAHGVKPYSKSAK